MMDFTDRVFNAHKCEIINSIKNAVNKSEDGSVILQSSMILNSIFNQNSRALCFIENDLFNPYLISFRYSDERRVKRSCTQYKFAKAFNLMGFECLFDGDPDLTINGLNEAKEFCENIDFRKLINLIKDFLKQDGLICDEPFRCSRHTKLITISKRKSFKDYFMRVLGSPS